MAVANRAQLLRAALMWRRNTGRARHRFDHDGADRTGIVQGAETFERVSAVGAPIRLADADGLMCVIVGMRQGVNSEKAGAESIAIRGDATDRYLAEADAVIGALAPDKAGASALAPAMG